MRRDQQLHVRLSVCELAALEALRGAADKARSQADVIADLLRREVAQHAQDPACVIAWRMLRQEDAEPRARAGRPATPPKPPPPVAAQEPPEPPREACGAPRVAEKPPPRESRGGGHSGRQCGRCGFPVEGRVCPRCGRVQPGA